MAVKVHITGGKGFLGRYLERSLNDAGGFEVEISDVDTLDVTDEAAVTAAFTGSKPDVVCHLAGLTGAGASLENPRRFLEVNTTGTFNVLEACRQAGTRGFVFLSSLTVHGQTFGEAVREDSQMRPRHPYAGSKAAAEMAVRTYAQCYDMKAANLRPTLIAGEGQAEANAVTEFIECVRSGKTIEIYGDGGHKREWLHPEDVGTAIAAAISWVARAEDTGWETFLVSSGEGVSMADLAKKVIAITGQGEVEFQPSTRQAFDLCTATDKARTELGWKPAIDIDEIIRRCL